MPAAPDFTFAASNSLVPSDGPPLGRSVQGQPGNGKELLDIIIGPGPVTLDVAPYLTTIIDPTWALLLAEGDGFQTKYDNVGVFSAKAFKSVMLQLTPNAPGPVGVLSMQLQFLGAAQRFRIMVLGN